MRMTGWAILVAVAFATNSISEAAVIEMYNDTAGPTASAPNVTDITSVELGGTVSGFLKDFATGTDTSITATLTSSNIVLDISQGVLPNSGTDAFDVFDGNVNLASLAAYDDGLSDWTYSVMFTGLDPSSTYEFVATVNRNSASYDVTEGSSSRWTQFELSGVSASTNASSSSVGVVGSGTLLAINNHQTDRGDIIQWTEIDPGVDGTFTVESRNVVDSGLAVAIGPYDLFRSYGMQGFRLTEVTPDSGPGPVVPEPSSLALLACGAIGLMGYRRRKQSTKA